MDDKDQTAAFQAAVERLIDQYCSEYDLSYSQIVGVLQMEVVRLSVESFEPEGDDAK